MTWPSRPLDAKAICTANSPTRSAPAHVSAPLRSSIAGLIRSGSRGHLRRSGRYQLSSSLNPEIPWLETGRFFAFDELRSS